MKKINLALGIHNHQPVGNFDFVFEEAYQKAYLPFLRLLERHPKIRVAQHYSGILFSWINDHKREFLPRLKRLVQSGQVEMMTGGFYEPIMSVIPYRDKIGQIEKLTNFVREQTGYEPRGMWLAERIWEPQLPKPLAQTGVKYVVLDDSHFKNAGLQDEQLHGYYITEEEGATVYLFPISETLRYTIPFQAPEKTIEYLRSFATEDGQSVAVFADDGEKFGIWPETHEHCYEQGWLTDFFQTLEDNLDWINILHFSEVVEKIKPLGRIYLPTASYREMMEWAMPSKAIHAYDQFEDILKENDLHDKYKVFVRGGFWRNFMTKYPEANNMHKKMLHISERLVTLEAEHGKVEALETAQDHLWAGQCNCPYWHGVFGGVYLNHLRYATYHEFIQAERILDELERDTKDSEQGWIDFREFDYDGDGLDEVLVTNRFMNLYFSPEKGASLFELDYKPKAINLLDTLTRREESYHQRLLELDQAHQNENKDEIQSIHDIVVVKEEGLQNMLFYDRYRRTSLLDHFLSRNTTLDDFAQSRYQEVGDFVNTPYEYAIEQDGHQLVIKFQRKGVVQFENKPRQVLLRKVISVPRSNATLTINYEIENLDSQPGEFWFGSELDFALLAGDAEDRYFSFPGHDLNDARLRSQGEIQRADALELVDEWLGVRIAMGFEKAGTVWRFPIETVSQSEAGFERVYQSSVVLPNWRFRLQPNEVWGNQIELVVEDFERGSSEETRD